MTTLYYLPVEKYKSRWTEFVSGTNGMFHHKVKKSNRTVQLVLIEPWGDTVAEIASGVVLDTFKRSAYGFRQIEALLQLIQAGTITSDDILYFEDFWQPGMEMIPYACHLKGIRPKAYAFCHAQSVDPNDFTHGMRKWMRSFEMGWANWLTGIFVAAKELKHMLVNGGIGSKDKIHVTGTVMARDVLIDRFYAGEPSNEENGSRANLVVFTSRTDKEKNPEWFIELARRFGNPHTKFLIASGREIPVQLIEEAQNADVHVRQRLSKKEYYSLLCQAKVMVNCADQDFVSYGLLEALAYGCLPLLPRYLTFPEAIGENQKYLYDKGDYRSACNQLFSLLRNEVPVYVEGDPVPDLYRRYGMKYEESVNRMFDIMFATPSLERRISEETSKIDPADF